MTVTVTTRGARELAVRFEQFPQELRAKLSERINEATESLYEAIRVAAVDRFSHPTGRLQSEIAGRLYDNESGRIAGYVSVRAGSDSNEYAKAATLEYGSDKPRKVSARAGSGAWMRITGSSRRIYGRTGEPAHIPAFMYLRGPFEEMRPEIEAALVEAISQVIAASDIGVAA